MRTQQDWMKRDVAIHWDQNSEERNPIRNEQLTILVSAVQATLTGGHCLLDLGYGSGKVEERLFQAIPSIRVVGVDKSVAMMELAESRLKPYRDRFQSVTWDLRSLPSLTLPDLSVQVVIAVQALHHLSESEMQQAYQWIHEQLVPGGVFLLMDRVAVQDNAWRLYQALWRRLDDQHGTELTNHEGSDPLDHQKRLASRGDYPVPLQCHLDWLTDIGFEVACLHVHTHRALLAAVKGRTNGGAP